MSRLILFFLFCFQMFPAHAEESILYRFRATLDGSDIGEHTFQVTSTSNGREVQSQANFKVKLLFITAYSYLHQAQEKWNGDCLTQLSSKTKENSDLTEVQGKQQDNSFVLMTPKGEKRGGECEMTFAYWNPKILSEDRLINPQTGEILQVKISPLGEEQISVRGVKQQASRYKITAPQTEIDVWYESVEGTMRWVALQSVTPEGYVVKYELV